jgi:hypothetical protein
MPLTVMRRLAATATLLLANLHHTTLAAEQRVSPIEKVIDLLNDLTQQVQEEGEKEAATYEKFACFCKDSVESKSEELAKSKDKIEELSATIEEKTAEQKDKQEAIMERKKKHETMSTDLEDATARCLKDEQKHQRMTGELDVALAGIKDAMHSLDKAKVEATSLLELPGPVRQSLELANTLQLTQTPRRREVTGFLQTDHDWHSGGVQGVLAMLEKEYRKQRDEADAEWTKVETSCKTTKAALTESIKSNKDAISKLEEAVEGLAKDLADAKEDLVSEQSDLKDSEAYLEDLHHRCEAGAKDWDQRLKTRQEELQALAEARSVLASSEKESAATLDFVAKPAAAAPQASPRAEVTSSGIKAIDEAAAATSVDEPQMFAGGVKVAGSDMPKDADAADVASWLHGGAAASFVQVDSTSNDRRAHVLAFVHEEGRRLDSAALTLLAKRLADDPFGKVKGLIQQLLERLLDEAAAEATKKGFCDTEVGKAKQARDYNQEEADKLEAEIKLLHAKEEALHEEIDELERRIDELSKEFEDATKIREEQHKDNIEALEKAKEGLTATTKALDILKSFYDKGKSASLLEASPVDEDAPEAPQGEYKGKQGGVQAILGLLEVVISDFEETLKSTADEEEKAARDFEEMKQNSAAEIAGHKTKRNLDIEDAKTTEDTIHKKGKEKQFALDSVESSKEKLEELSPMCLEKGMSSESRVQKREQEMEALKRALCQLDTEGVEPECK